MITELRLTNFKGHKETILNFKPGVNVITGESQAGKTDIVRAIIWLISNRPLGGSVMHNDCGEQGEVSVSITTSDGYFAELWKVIKRDKKGKKQVKGSVYTLESVDPTGEIERLGEYSGVARDVPDIIPLAINISDINIQKQLDLPYLITESPGEVARAINRITKLEEVDQWIYSLSRLIRDHERDIKRGEKDAELLLEQLEKDRALDLLEDVTDQLIFVDHEIQVQAKTHEKIQSLNDDLIHDTQQIAIIYGALDQLDRVLLDYDTNKKKLDGLYEIQDLLLDLNFADRDIALYDNLLLSSVSLSDAEELHNTAEDLWDLLFTIDDLHKAEMDIENFDTEESLLIKEFENIIRKHPICPTCSHRLKIQDIDAILEEL